MINLALHVLAFIFLAGVALAIIIGLLSAWTSTSQESKDDLAAICIGVFGLLALVLLV